MGRGSREASSRLAAAGSVCMPVCGESLRAQIFRDYYDSGCSVTPRSAGAAARGCTSTTATAIAYACDTWCVNNCPSSSP